MRFLSIVLVLAMGVWSNVGQMLVLCQGADGHTELEPVSASCCTGAADSGRATPASVTESKPEGCGGSCSDTLLLTSVDRPTPPRSVSPVATMPLPLSQASLASLSMHDSRRTPAADVAQPQQLTVLRI